MTNEEVIVAVREKYPHNRWVKLDMTYNHSNLAKDVTLHPFYEIHVGGEYGYGRTWEEALERLGWRP